MNQKQPNIRLLAQMALLTAVMLIMAFTPLGYIPLPFMNATTMHIPVILGACLLGPKMGGVLGGLFGVTSVIKATLQPNITSFVFTPFYSFNEQFHGTGWSFVVAILPRVLIGVVAGWVFLALWRAIGKRGIALAVAGFAGAMMNTVGVMTLIYIFFGAQYAAAAGHNSEVLLGVIVGIIGINGVPEALIAAVLTCAIGKALSSTQKMRSKSAVNISSGK